MNHESEHKSKISHPEVSLLRISHLLSRCQETANNLKEGGPELQHFRMTSLLNKTAFTLIELLVVVLIIGILAAVAVPQYQKAVAKSESIEIIQFIQNSRKALELYLLNNSPVSTGETDKIFYGNWRFGGGDHRDELDFPIPLSSKIIARYSFFVALTINDWGCIQIIKGYAGDDFTFSYRRIKKTHTWSGSCTATTTKGSVICQEICLHVDQVSCP